MAMSPLSTLRWERSFLTTSLLYGEYSARLKQIKTIRNNIYGPKIPEKKIKPVRYLTVSDIDYGTSIFFPLKKAL